MYASKEGKIEIVTELLKHGANTEYHDESGLTALFEAVDGGNVEVVRLLLSCGAIVNASSLNG